MVKYYPANLNIEGKKCVVVGAGLVAERKVRRLLECGGKVYVVSPETTTVIKTFARRNKLILKVRAVNRSDLKDAFLVISATSNRRINSFICQYCKDNNILVNIVDSPVECNFIVPSVISRGDLLITISTSGVSPAFSKKLRQRLEKDLGPEYAKFLSLMRQIRPQVIKKIKTLKTRKAFFTKVVKSNILSLIKQNKIKQAKDKLRKMLSNG